MSNNMTQQKFDRITHKAIQAQEAGAIKWAGEIAAHATAANCIAIERGRQPFAPEYTMRMFRRMMADCAEQTGDMNIYWEG